MNSSDLRELYAYNRWAHARVLDSAAQLTSEQYSQDLGGSFPSVRATLEHILAAEVIWLSRWEGNSLGEWPDYGGCTEVAALKSMWMSFWNRQSRFLRDMTEEDLSQLVAIRTRSGIETAQPLSDSLIHVVNHSTYHRGQVSLQIRQLGGVPQATDYFFYRLERTS